MATIVIDRDTLQDHIETECKIEVTSFGWSTYHGVTDVEYDTRVKEDLVYEDDAFVTIEEYSDMEQTCKQVMEELDTLEETSAKKIKELTDKVNELSAQLESSKVWYKFWK
jgi:hypothetical protein